MFGSSARSANSTSPTVLLFDIDGTFILTGGAGRRAMTAAFADTHRNGEACSHFSFAAHDRPRDRSRRSARDSCSERRRRRPAKPTSTQSWKPIRSALSKRWHH